MLGYLIISGLLLLLGFSFYLFVLALNWLGCFFRCSPEAVLLLLLLAAVFVALVGFFGAALNINYSECGNYFICKY